MENNNSENRSIEFNEKEKNGIITLPNCELIIKYEPKEGKIKYTNSYNKNLKKEGKLSIKNRDIDSMVSILKTLIQILKRIPGMDKQDARHSLLSFFPIEERNGFNKSDNIHTELQNIVTYAADLGKVDLIIDAAENCTQNKDNREQLISIRKKYIELKEKSKKEHICKLPKTKSKI